jgi:hypothetical protein
VWGFHDEFWGEGDLNDVHLIATAEEQFSSI